MDTYVNANEDADQLVETHSPMVKRIAHHLKGRLPQSVPVDDLIQAGMIGLLEASKNYDKTKGASFETYAGIRIRGMMLDEVRKNDWVPRSVYRMSRELSEAIRDLENKLGRDAKDVEIAECLGLSLDEYYEKARDANVTQIHLFDDVGLTDDNFSRSMTSAIPNPERDIVYMDLKKKLAGCINGLPEREKLVLTLYYVEELNLKEIGSIMQVSESRVCQIHSQAMHRLQARLPDWKQ